MPKPWVQRIAGFLFGFIVLCVLSIGVYYGIGWLKPAFGDAAIWILTAGLAVIYLGLLILATRYPELEPDDPKNQNIVLPAPGPTIKSGLHFVLPVIVLIWCLMVERLSPGLSAFYATTLMVGILLTQRPIKALLRGEGRLGQALVAGVRDLFDGLVAGARNMIGIGIATATAGIIVGSVSQTGVGSALAEVVEILSMGNILLILIYTAILSLILGMGLPTTANYIVVSSLLAPVIVTLGVQNGLIVPLIAVHLFVFYFGIMADVTPPVGLASFAAAAVSKGDPIRTGFQAFYYSLRTAALPFLFIFNTDLLLIDVTWLQGIFVFCMATVAMLIFAAALQGYFFTRSRWYESIALVLIAFTLFRPGFWMDMIYPPYEDVPPPEIMRVAGETPAGTELRLRIDGVDDIGQPISFVAILPLGEGTDGEQRLLDAGVELMQVNDALMIDHVAFGSPAQRAGLDWDQTITAVLVPTNQPWKELLYIPALLALGMVITLQRRRHARRSIPTVPA
jgi:hypothetical protein